MHSGRGEAAAVHDVERFLGGGEGLIGPTEGERAARHRGQQHRLEIEPHRLLADGHEIGFGLLERLGEASRTGLRHGSGCREGQDGDRVVGAIGDFEAEGGVAECVPGRAGHRLEQREVGVTIGLDLGITVLASQFDPPIEVVAGLVELSHVAEGLPSLPEGVGMG